MIIDCHTHIWHDGEMGGTIKNLLKSMDAAKIDKSLVFIGRERMDVQLKGVLKHKDRLHAVAIADPLGNEKYQKRLGSYVCSREPAHEINKLQSLYEEGKIVAVKFYTGYDHYFPYDDEPATYLEVLQKIRCPAIFHCGDCLNTVKDAKLRYAHPLGVDDVAVNYPNMKFIIAHMGFPWVKDAAEVCYKNSNVYSDISGFVYGEFTNDDQRKFNNVIGEFVDICPGKKLLFGSDWPISSQKSYMDAMDLKAVERMSATVQKVFKL